MPVAVQCADIHVFAAGADAQHLIPIRDPRIDERAEILVVTLRAAPHLVQFVEGAPGHLECAPYPVRCSVGLFHLDLGHAGAAVREHCVEKFRACHRKKQERKHATGKLAQGVKWRPDRIGQADDNLFVGWDERGSAEDGIAQPTRSRLHHVSNVRAP